MIMKFKLQLFVVFAVLAVICPSMYAQGNDQNYAAEESAVFENGSVSIKQKLPSFFHTASKETPKEQFAHAQSLIDTGKSKDAINELNDLIHTWPASTLAPDAQLAVALEFEKLGKYERAFNELQYLIAYYPNKFPYDVAIKHQMAIANQMRTSKKSFLGIPMGSNKALSIDFYNQIVKNAPNWDQTPLAELYSCMLQENTGDYTGAIAGYELLMQQFPGSQHIPEAKFRRLSCLFGLTKTYKRDQQVYLTAMEAAAEFIRDYPTNENVDQAKIYYKSSKNSLAKMNYEIGVFYDKQKKWEPAIIEYSSFLDSFPDSQYSNAARKRLKQLKKKSNSGKSKSIKK
jgi:outer membrane protein assembly factor BamD